MSELVNELIHLGAAIGLGLRDGYQNWKIDTSWKSLGCGTNDPEHLEESNLKFWESDGGKQAVQRFDASSAMCSARTGCALVLTDDWDLNDEKRHLDEAVAKHRETNWLRTRL